MTRRILTKEERANADKDLRDIISRTDNKCKACRGTGRTTANLTCGACAGTGKVRIKPIKKEKQK